MRDMRSSDAMQPLVFAILQGLIPSDVETELFDERLESIPYDAPTDLVAITVETQNAYHAYEISAEFRKRGVPVVMGGYHATLLPEEAAQHADSIVIGDAEVIWPQVIRDAKIGKLQRIYQQQVPVELEDVRFDRIIYSGKKYVPLMPVQYGRGCRFACDFCSIHAFYGNKQKQRSIAEIIKEIETFGKQHIIFIDDNLFVDPVKMEAFLRALIPLKIRWSCQISIDIAQYPKLMNLLEQSGCSLALIGFESLDGDNLTQMKKNWNLKHDDYPTVVQKFRDHGIMLYGTFIFGYDHDSTDAFDISLDFAHREKFFLANFNPLTPTPGTKLYDRLQRENRLLYDRWWLEKEYRYGQATFTPKGMTADELTEGCYRVRRSFFSYQSILNRGLHTLKYTSDYSIMGIFLKSNLISRKEIIRKQGSVLGDQNTSLEPNPIN